MTAKSPQPTSGTSLRMRMMRSVQFNNESGWRRWFAAGLGAYPAGQPLTAVAPRREATADAAVIELHVGFGPKGREHLVALLFGQAAEIELVMVAQEQAPLRRRRARPGGLERFD